MTNKYFSRRGMLKGSAATGALLATAGSLDLLAFAKAWAADAPFKPEPGAKLSLTRWKRFVQSEDDAFRSICKSFAEATGCSIEIAEEGMDDVQPKASVAANTGQGSDMFWGIYTVPQLFPEKALDVSDVCKYLGDKYGGWVDVAQSYGKAGGKGEKWIDVPVCMSGNYINYRISSVKKAGFDKVPEDTDGFLELMKAMKANGTPGGFALGHASGDGNAWVHWLLWAHGGSLTDQNDKVAIDSPETRNALKYCKALYETFTPGTISWNDSFNNKAFLAGDVHLTNNGISIYVAAKNGDEKTKAIAEDMDHAYNPIGPVGNPTEFQVCFPIMGMGYTKYPNAVKAFLTYWMEADQYNKWISDSQGYMTHTLNAFDANDVWTQDPKRAVFRDAAKRTLTAGYPGSIGENAASALADFIVIDMFASYASGQQDMDGAIRQAERSARRIYR